jgi:N-acetylglucosamine kinase-like BadF-type ATPase
MKGICAMDYIIGVDAGGTKTEATAYDLEDKKIAGSLAGPGNPAVDFEGAKGNIKDAVFRCILNLNTQGIEGVCQGIYLGAAGIEVGKNIELLESYLREAFKCDVVGLHDSELAHAAILKGKDGIITIAGTGSVSYGRYDGKTGKTGGWGHVLGDEGSGYWIALEALKHMTHEQDSGMMASELSQRIMAHLGVIDVDGMKEFVHAASKNEIAELALIVAELAQTGDRHALDILDRAGIELAILTEKLYKKLEIPQICTVGVSGGILRNVAQVRERFCACMDRDLGAVLILDDEISPTKGACYLHRRKQVKIMENLEVAK